MESNINTTAVQDQEEIFSFREFLGQCAKYWQWFVASVVIFCGLGFLYVLRQQPVYQREMALLIKDNENGGVSDIASAFSSMGLVSSNTNVNNELISLTSPAVMAEVVKRLELEVNYTRKGKFHGNTLYGTNLPIKVSFLDLDEQEFAGFRMEMGSNGSVKLSKFYKGTSDGVVKINKEVMTTIGFKPVNTPLGRVIVSPNGKYIAPKKKNADESNIIFVSHAGLQNTIESYTNKLKGDLADKDADVIQLSMKDVSTQRAVEVLDNVVTVYNENWVQDKNKVAVATSKFIDERLHIIEGELGNVDSDISKYKSENLVPDLTEAAKLGMQESTEVSRNMLDLTNQMTMCVFLRDYVNNPSNSDSVIPVNTGIGSPALETEISTYNSLLLNRNSLVQNSSVANPLVQDYDIQIRGLRESIVRGINAQVASLNTAMKNLRGAKGAVDSQLASGPKQAKYLLSVERRQKVTEALYLFLLQKREENELTQTFTAYNTRIITPPTGSLKPVAPKKNMILAVAFLLGLCVPGVALYIVVATNTTVRSRKDIEFMSTPFAGEIPFKGKVSMFRKFAYKFLPAKKKDSKDMENVLDVVSPGSRDMISESFRIVRGNIEFMIHKKEGCSVLMMTSYNAGSGKSFISYNLASSFALKNKRVLLVDCDLRHGSASQFVGMPSKGLSNYLTGNVDTWKNFVVPVENHPGMFVMPIGHRPPNPAELLDTDRFERFVNEARENYDYILLDCPPANVVADTKIVSKFVDRTIFIIRVGLFDRQMVSEVDALYKSKSYPQMSIVLNGTDTHGSGRYGSYNSHYGSYYGSYYSTKGE